jgi:pSer/pThr/pTyr-binding forkhead associated (FHA) protein
MLEVVQGNDAGREFELADEAIVLGRDKDCCVLIDDEQASRRHAQLTLAGDAYAIEDLRSTNGS